MRPLAAALLWLLGAALPAAAQEFPALYRVTGVAANDVLNIRSAPSAAAAVIGRLAPGQAGVEVVAADPSGKWVQVNAGETAGWAALRYLSPEPDNADYPLAQSFTCFGTEPFWTLQVRQGGTAVFSAPGESAGMAAGTLQPAAGRLDRYVLRLADGAAAVIRHESCNDGMSDRQFGLSADVLMNRDGMALLSGCCSIAP